MTSVATAARSALPKKGSPKRAKQEGRASAAAAPKSQAAEREILDAAAIAFTQRGYAATSVDDVAAVLGSTKGRIYHYYQSKFQLLLGIARLGLTSQLESVQPLARESQLPATQRLYRMAHRHAMVVMSSLALHRVALLEVRTRMAIATSARQERLLQGVLSLRDDYEVLYTKAIEDGIRSGEFQVSSARMASKHVLGALNGLLTWYRPKKSARPTELEAIASDIAAFVVKGLSPGSPTKLV